MNALLTKEGEYLRKKFKDDKNRVWSLRYSTRIGAYPLQFKDVFFTESGSRFETTRDIIFEKAETGVIKAFLK